MTPQERLDKELYGQKLMMRYQLVTDFIKKLADFYAEAPNAFNSVVDLDILKKAVGEMNDLKTLYLSE